MSKRKRILREKRQAKHQKAAMRRQKHEIEQMAEECFSNIMDMLIDNIQRQEAYRWN
jgi:hypothetical protein